MIIEPNLELQLKHVETLVMYKDYLVRPQKTIDLWIWLFSDILDDEQLTKELRNMLKETLEA